MRERLEREARALRVAGHSMPEVARRVDVPASTLYQWAAAGGWRGCDLAEAAARAAMDAAAQAGRPGAQEGSRDEGRDEGRDDSGPEDAAEAPAPLTSEQLSAEAERCARAAMALSRGGRMKDADAALKLAERYRELAPLAASARREDEDGSEERAKVNALRAQAMVIVKRWVRMALQGKIQQMPAWASTKAFLADTPYAHMYYRPPGLGQVGHFGPGPCDLVDDAEGDAEADSGQQIEEYTPYEEAMYEAARFGPQGGRG
jgi:hypothetical protein